MGSVVPYLIRAYCDWIEDSSLTPHILVSCKMDGIVVPKGLAKKEKIVLNVSSSATENRLITNSFISFKTRFNGRPQKVIIPCNAVLGIYAHENGEGMLFDSALETESSKSAKPGLTVLD